MASTIKVDTIENVAGSGNVSLGSGHNLVVHNDYWFTEHATLGVTKVDTSTAKLDALVATPDITHQINRY